MTAYARSDVAFPAADGTVLRGWVYRPDGAYIVTGGLGGLGLFMAERMAANGCGRIVLSSRSQPSASVVEILDRIRATGNPMVLTVNGKAELIVQDAEAYQALLDRVETLEGIQRGVADVKAGRTKPAQQVFDKLRRKHGIPR